MNKFKQCIYTVILLLTCFVASPFIYKHIWETSKPKEAKVAAKEPVVVTQPAGGSQDTTNEGSTEAAQPTSEGETTAPVQQDEPEQPTTSPVNWVQSSAEYFDDALFIGDSRTDGLFKYGTLKNAQYFCDVGLQAYQIDTSYVNGQTIWEFLSGKKFGKIYVMLGINEVGNDIEYTVSAYRKLIDGIRQSQPDALIYLEANLHVTTAGQTQYVTNERINILNSRIQELADNQKTFYIDVNGVFDDEYGALTSDYTEDGIHVFAKYYATWCDWLCANTVAPANNTAEAASAAAQPSSEAATYTSEPATTKLPQNEEFSNQ